MKRYLIFIALLGLGFGACKKDQTTEPKKDSEAEFAKKAGLTTPQPEAVFAQRVEACATGFLNEIKPDYDYFNPIATSNFKKCLKNIVPPVPKKPTNNPYPPNSGSPAVSDGAAKYNLPQTFDTLIKMAGISSPTTTQDSVNRFMNRYEKLDYIIKNAAFPWSSNLDVQLNYALNNSLTQYVLTAAGDIVYPNAGMAYLLSVNSNTLLIPAHWPNYGFNFFARLDVKLDPAPPLEL
ncbi:hypothetical protein [Sphingobacterium sp. UBA5996]|uniref:hypothetical protein n=1 Tax=Sphingobacterium sp. UBA5996 TaxID=1947505 RepID=UPI0025D456AF|nr:hypothetical protein [Sphingobacterium sp. UBA5996]